MVEIKKGEVAMKSVALLNPARNALDSLIPKRTAPNESANRVPLAALHMLEPT